MNPTLEVWHALAPAFYEKSGATFYMIICDMSMWDIAV